jgi:hypothetical protein
MGHGCYIIRISHNRETTAAADDSRWQTRTDVGTVVVDERKEGNGIYKPTR